MVELDMRDIGRCLRAVREEIGLSADELGERVGVHGPTITRFEVGKALNPTFETLYRLLDYLGEQDIIKKQEFDFSKYNTTTARIVNSFKKGEQSLEYKDCRDEYILYLYQNKDYMPVSMLEAFALVIESNKAFEQTENALTQTKGKIESYGENINTMPYNNIMSRMFDCNGKEFNTIIANMINTKTQKSVLEYTNKTLALFYAYVLSHLEDKIGKNADVAKQSDANLGAEE